MPLPMWRRKSSLDTGQHVPTDRVACSAGEAGPDLAPFEDVTAKDVAMNLYTLLAARSEAGRPVRVGLIGAGKFGSMVLSQAQRIAGYQWSPSPI